MRRRITLSIGPSILEGEMAVRKAISDRVRFKVFNRDRFTCGYCGEAAPKVILELDHKVAHSKGGTDAESNLLTACRDCNRGKSDSDAVAPAGGVYIRPAKHPLIGMGVHCFEDGVLQSQACVMEVIETHSAVGDMASCLFFDWIAGDPNYRLMIPISDFSGVGRKTYRFFPNMESANDHHEQSLRHSRKPKQATAPMSRVEEF